MPFLLPLLAGVGIAGWAFAGGEATHAAITTPPQSLPNGSNPAGLNLTTIAGYAIMGGLVYYFGKKIIK